MLTTRVLPAEEWPRLAGTDLESLWPLMSPVFHRVIVAEDEGRIVGHCVVFTWVHLDGLWVDEARRGGGDVWRRLLHAVGAVGRQSGVKAMVAGSDTEAMRDYLARLGGERLPAEFFVVPMQGFFQKESEPCLPS